MPTREPLSIDGYLVAGKGSTVEGLVINTDPRGRVPLHSDVVSREAERSAGKDATRIGIVTGIAGAIGAIAGGGKGPLWVLERTRPAEAVSPWRLVGAAAEDVLYFRLTAPPRFQELRK